MRTTTLFASILAAITVAALPQATPSFDEILSSPMTFEKRQSNSTSPKLPDATVQLCTQPQFQGECANATWPVNKCIDLPGYAGVVESFMPKKGFSCLVTQGVCDATKPFVEIGDDDVDKGCDLTKYEWIGNVTSYICFTEIEALRRFVRVARLRVTGAKALEA